MHELRSTLAHIETTLDDGTYQPGAWAAFLRSAMQQPPAQLAMIADDVSRVSDKLHRRQPRPTFTCSTGLLAEWLATGGGVLLLRTGLRHKSGPAVWLAATIFASTFQPLIKVHVGQALGIRYSFMYIQGAEPRFKMRYGSYLASARWKRVLLHLSGTVGTPLALTTVSVFAAPVLPVSARVCAFLAVLGVGLQVVPFVAGLLNVQHPPALVTLVRESSGGHAARELRLLCATAR